MDESTRTTREKALAINLDATTYGTFAEIGLIGLAVGLPAVRRVADEEYYTDLPGGVLESVGLSLLSIHTPEVLDRIQRGDPSWEAMVPAAVAEMIKAKNLFVA
jgi:hypothetical protein